ncbi:rhomboid protein 1, mitochondrial [Podospora fimiseda]|uniref:Rhomboid protein 1, mitochondrial n=1 Tax=Podospora fimiseda TaxID=252190 RepID=A0AAN7BU63_9PEZI|nr:rhomboid protein 1, mitochondrial [Podospora fimiseda]
MSCCCTLGVNAFRSSVQIAARHVSTKSSPVIRLLPAASTRRYSSIPSFFPPQARNTLVIKSSQWLLPRQRLGFRTIFNGNIVFKHYTELPPDYTDETGLAFSKYDLKAGEITAIFGPSMTTAEGNRLLRILHGRRVAGTLEDPSLARNLITYSKRELSIALEYLRKHVPVDETANAGLRAEDELRILEGTEEDIAEEIDPETNKEDSPSNALRSKFYTSGPGDKKPTSVYGDNSIFDDIRAKNKAKWEAELKRREEEQKKQKEEGKNGVAGPLAPLTQEQREELMSPRMKEWRRRGTSDLEAPPEKSTWELMLPTTLFVVLTIGAVGSIAYYYTPPKRADRLFPNIPPAAATVGAVILANLAIAVAWKIPPLYRVLNRYFIFCPTVPVVPSIMGAIFSHHKLIGHFTPNMIFLWFFGTKLHDDVGRANFLTIYLGSGMLGFLATMVEAVVLRNNIGTLGSSGAIYGLMGAYFWLHRLEGFKILNLPPPPSEGIHGITFLAIAVGWNIAMLLGKKRFVFDITSHLAGAAAGVAAGHMLERRRKKALASKADKVAVVPISGATNV